MYHMVHRLHTCQSFAPSVLAASSCERSIVSKMGMSSRTTKGRVTNMVARAIPAEQCVRGTAVRVMVILNMT